MADIFDEIDEELKRDQMQVLWARYGKIIIAVVASIVVIVGVRQGFTAWKISKSETSAEIYQQSLRSDDVTDALRANHDDLAEGYRMLSQFQIAAEYASRDNNELAEKVYLEIAADKSIDPIYQQAATLLSIMVAPEDADLNLLLGRLSDMETLTGPWQAMALETGAGVALRLGDQNLAIAKYKKLAEMNDIPVGMRQRADRILAILSN